MKLKFKQNSIFIVFFMLYFFFFLLTFLISLFLTLIVRNIMRHFKIVDYPKLEKRKIHRGKIPYGGGLAIYVSFFIVVAIIFWSTNYFGPNITSKELLAMFLGGLVLMIGGILDDKYVLKAKSQIWFPVLAGLIMIFLKPGSSGSGLIPARP